ncbi:MAG: hypothetical protein E7470_02150 [Ruminococcaceae bacterium]|nr:hypothetical protein [Oscillospiraceae bacterium]
MHTFFINTSQKELNGYDVLFDIHRENKALVSMECPMSDWYDPDKGYIACVKQMSDMIDGYVELNNAFNLIIYIDLPENKAYSSIQRDAFHDKEREECCRAMHILFTHVVSESIVHMLTESGRRPQNVLLMFGEEKRFADFHVAPNDPSRASVMRRVFDYIGLPQAEEVESIAKATDKEADQDKITLFEQRILDKCGEELVPGIRGGYREGLQLWCNEIMTEANIQQANDALFERINSINRAESDRVGIEIISCPYDCYASRVNKSVLALSELNLALYVLKCVELNSIFELTGDGQKHLIAFHVYSVQEIAPILTAKMEIYAEKVTEIETLSKSYADLHLAPRLAVFDHGKFGLDMYGDIATELVIGDAEQETSEENPQEGDEAAEEETEADATVSVIGNEKEVSVVRKRGRTLFSAEEYVPFDYDCQIGRDKVIGKNPAPEQYIERAKSVRKHHLDYLKKLKLHVSQALSNYAGKSKENKPALLQMGGYRYAAPGTERKALETVEDVAGKAYQSMVDQYMEFCAGRSVAITDIEQQCNWFVTRVHQIQESLRKITLVGICMLLALIVLYIPFVWIQFQAITENFNTILTALGSLLAPIVLLTVIFGILVALQHRKYKQAWAEFEKKSEEALEANKLSVQKFDQLLSVVIPALRWVYEYKLDVDYCAECCSVADAKIEHHRRKLRDRVVAIQNILSDLEYQASEEKTEKTDPADVSAAVDYDVAFCSGKKNRSFYSVIDSTVLLGFNR